MNSNILLHCSDPSCSALIYLDESISGRMIPAEWGRDGAAHHGRYCVESARKLGWWSPDDLTTLEEMLRSNEMLRRPGDRPTKVVKHRAPKVSPDQLTLGLE